jgi:signal transduction histidine kinase
MRTLGRRFEGKSARGPALLVGGLIACSVGFLMFLATATVIEKDSAQRFENHAYNARNAINARIKSYTDVLRGSAAFFSATDEVTQSEFHDFVATLQVHENFPAIEVINYAQFVRDTQLAAFEREIRAAAAAQGYDPSTYRTRPPGRRPEYALMKYVEPGTTWWDTMGLDLMAVPQAGKVVEYSRDTGTLITSGRPIAAISGPNRTGLGMRLPVYRRGTPLRNKEQRRAAYIGSVGIAFSVDKLVNGVLEAMPVKKARMTLVDKDNRDASIRTGSDGRVLYDSAGTTTDPTPPLLNPGGKFIVTLPIDFNGRNWEATFSVAKESIFTSFDRYMPWASMCGGVVTAALLYALFHTMSTARRNAVELAEAMTRDLRESQAKLQRSHENLRRIAAHADKIKEGERKRIAREIHDDLGQNLLALRIEADMLAARTGERHSRLHARALATLQQIDSTIRSVRQIINDLRPNVLDLGLSAAVEWLLRDFERRTGILVELHDEQKEARLLDDDSATALFRILQESLSNVSRHARASIVRVTLDPQDGWLVMTVQDNGIGFVQGGRARIGSFGLIGIEERINLLGGRSSIKSSPGEGTTVLVSIPLDHLAPCDTQAHPAGPAATSHALA